MLDRAHKSKLQWGVRYALIAAFLVAGCQTAKAPPMMWVRVDGVSMVGNEDLARQFEADIVACRGIRQRTLIVAPAPVNAFDAAGMNAALRDVARGCMADRGYLLRPRPADPSKYGVANVD